MAQFPGLSKLKPAEKFQTVWNQIGYGHEETEFPFREDRNWRWDYAWPDLMLAVEIDGFGYGHQAQQNIARQNEKRNAAAEDGWTVLVYDSRLLGSEAKVIAAVEQVCRILERSSGPEYIGGFEMRDPDGQVRPITNVEMDSLMQ